MLRSVLAIVIGFVVIGSLVGVTDLLMHSMFADKFGPSGRVDDVGILVVTQIYVFTYAVFGCYLCARIAERRPMFHALFLGALGLILNIVASYMTWQLWPAWYHIVALLAAVPAAWLGGWLRERQIEHRPLGLRGATA